MLSNTNLDKYTNLQLYYSSHEGELYITDDTSVIIKVYYFDNIDPDFDSIINIVNICMDVSKLIPEYVPEIYLKYETNNYTALVMEKINGITLAKYLVSRENHNIDTTFKIISSLCNAVFALHDAKYIHGDLHGNNIMIYDDYKIKLIDFGQSDSIDSISASDDSPNIYGDYLCLKYYIARLIFPKLEESNIVVTIKTIKNFTVEDVIGYDEFPELADKLYNILDSFPKVMENNIDD